MAGIAVEQDDRGADAEAGHQVVPHHPAGRGEPEEAVVRPEVALQSERLEVFDGDAAVPVHDRLGQAGGARREQDVQRLVEGDAGELQRAGFGHEVGPGRGPVDRGGALVEVGQPDDGAHAGQASADRLDLRSSVDRLGAVLVAVDGQQERGLDLLPPVDDALHPELRSTRAEDGAEAGGGQHEHQGLGDVRGVGGHAVAGTDGRAHEAGPRPGHLVTQLGGGDAQLVARLRPGDHDDVVVGAPGHAEHRLGVVQAQAWEPHRTRHAGVSQGRGGVAVSGDVQELPHG
jgi:hypothetical protein